MCFGTVFGETLEEVSTPPRTGMGKRRSIKKYYHVLKKNKKERGSCNILLSSKHILVQGKRGCTTAATINFWGSDRRHEVCVCCGKGWGRYLFVEIGQCGTTMCKPKLWAIKPNPARDRCVLLICIEERWNQLKDVLFRKNKYLWERIVKKKKEIK